MNPLSQDLKDDDTPQNWAEVPSSDQPLGWEGHVHFPDGPPLWSRVLKNWPELRTGLAFSLVFVVGAFVGGSIAALVGCNRLKSAKDNL